MPREARPAVCYMSIFNDDDGDEVLWPALAALTIVVAAISYVLHEVFG